MIVDEENQKNEDDDLYSSRKTKNLFGGTSYGQQEEGEVPYHSVEYMHDVPLNLVVEIGQNQLTIKEILALKKSSVIEFTKVVGEPMDIIVGGRLMARGEIVVVNERYGVRISEVTRPEEGDRSL